ncbi:MAG: signal peptide peptidase SppA [Helicobacteraceae bacterium]|jgi:protease-4|nr:signal peptide peptidase SppA [Helicobacteraceae bacterium]
MEDIKRLIRVLVAPIVFIQHHFKATLLVLFVALLVLSANQPRPMPNLYRINLYGAIIDPTAFLAEVQEASRDHIRGVLLVVDSPGGSVPPSVEMMMAIKELSDRKPVVAYSAGVMASGSYYASIWADEIIANPGSIIGSIGVVMEGVNAAELLAKIGVKMRVVKAGELKEAGTFYREWTQQELAQLEAVTNGIYAMFVSDVAQARGLNIADAKTYANGRIFTASQALEAGLIDNLGSLPMAQERITELSGVPHGIWNEESEFDKLIKQIEGEAKLMIMDMLLPSIKMSL